MLFNIAFKYIVKQVQETDRGIRIENNIHITLTVNADLIEKKQTKAWV